MLAEIFQEIFFSVSSHSGSELDKDYYYNRGSKNNYLVGAADEIF